MSILNGVVTMNLDSAGYDEPSTPLRDPTSSPAVHIQWQNSQSACAAMEELRVASSVPRRREFLLLPTRIQMCDPPASAPQPLTFGFELPASAGPSSSASDPFLPSRTRGRSVRSRALGRVQSQSQNDVLAIPAADASKFLDMLGRASARVDENSRKRMRARESELSAERARAQRSSRKGKERVRATVVTRSLDELGDHTSSRRDTHATGVRYSSLPIMQPKDPLSQPRSTMPCAIREAANKDDEDVHMHASDADADVPGSVVIELLPLSTRPQNGTQNFPPRSAAAGPTTTTTTHSQNERLEPPSLTPVRPAPAAAPTPLRVLDAELLPASTNKPSAIRAHAANLPKSSQGPLPHISAHLSSSSSTCSQHPVPAPAPTPQPLPQATNQSPSGAGPAAAAAPTTSQSLSQRCTSTSTCNFTSTSTSATSTSVTPALPLPLPASQAHGSRRALGMTRNVLRAPSNTPHSAAAKKPFRPPLARPAPGACTTTTVPRFSSPAAAAATSTSPHDSKSSRKRQGDGKSSAADPDSSFDLSFDFDPEALEVAMKKFD